MKIGEFLCSHFNIEDERKHATFSTCDVLLFQERSLAGVAQWIECQPVNQRVTGSIPTQGTSLGCGPGPQLGTHERQPHIDVSLSFSLPSPLKISK